MLKCGWNPGGLWLEVETCASDNLEVLPPAYEFLATLFHHDLAVRLISGWLNTYQIPSGNDQHSELENHHAINGKIHYFYGHVQ